ncbi:unnamed protein product [Clonostachys chloroleuca]|uniref:Uncharacterized protein n=1 Tax=Clonostachys chloroleuca TaxID=1926264 RepID=A0AA35MAS3_9HYPO|nr:unnamed protein product [Clonostachys chloroleuca]
MVGDRDSAEVRVATLLKLQAKPQISYEMSISPCGRYFDSGEITWLDDRLPLSRHGSSSGATGIVIKQEPQDLKPYICWKSAPRSLGFLYRSHEH